MMCLERDVSMFLGWVCVALVAQHFQRIDQARTGLLGLDHIVNISALCGDVRIGKFFLIVRHQFGFLFTGSSALSSSLRKMIFTAPSGPMTAISAVGQARFTVTANVLG